METMRRNGLVAMASMLVVMPAQAALKSMDDAALRAVSGQAGTLVYDPPGFVLKLDALAQDLSNSGHPLAAALVARQARFLGNVFDGCPRGAYCTL
jgi:hypothetical protein